jgi:SpoIID/LytB domain protein
MEPGIRVGILVSENISFSLHGDFVLETLHQHVQGFFCVQKEGQILVLKQDHHILGTFRDLEFSPASANSYFSLENVSIGIDFHWERKEKQTFEGKLQLRIETDRILAINCVPVEKYLLSVISSEMKATSSLEYLKAHAIISRSWLLAQLEKKKNGRSTNPACTHTEEEWIQWFDREDHTSFDVCADDHCQRYQGINKASTPQVREAVETTRGLVLQYQNEICDARFYKCCGGISEAYENNWDHAPKPYLQPVRDVTDISPLPDLRVEKEAEEFIKSSPDAFCNIQDPKILSQILNDYDLETQHFYRWKVTYSQEEISSLIARKSGMDFGRIKKIIPLERGFSGRIIRLKIEGTLKTMVIGKELMIRKMLSESHLYSSAFIVEYSDIRDEIPASFNLYGAGWGHGAGLCQIGAAVMGNAGYSYQEILNHYYKESQIVSRYT